MGGGDGEEGSEIQGADVKEREKERKHVGEKFFFSF